MPFYCSILAFFLSASAAVAAPWVVDAQQSTLTFTGTQAGDAFHGSFSKFTPLIEFDPAHPERGSIHVTIDIASATIDDKTKQEALPTDDWFATAKFPPAEFQSTAIRDVGSDKIGIKMYEATGTLSIRGIQKTITLPFSLKQEGAMMDGFGTITLNRHDFGIGQGQWMSEQWVAYPVVVAFRIFAKPAK